MASVCLTNGIYDGVVEGSGIEDRGVCGSVCEVLGFGAAEVNDAEREDWAGSICSAA